MARMDLQSGLRIGSAGNGSLIDFLKGTDSCSSLGTSVGSMKLIDYSFDRTSFIYSV